MHAIAYLCLFTDVMDSWHTFIIIVGPIIAYMLRTHYLSERLKAQYLQTDLTLCVAEAVRIDTVAHCACLCARSSSHG